MNVMTRRVGLLLVAVMLVGCKGKDAGTPTEAAPAPKAAERPVAAVARTQSEPAPAEPAPVTVRKGRPDHMPCLITERGSGTNIDTVYNLSYSGG